jgi:hypothetical protein
MTDAPPIDPTADYTLTLTGNEVIAVTTGLVMMINEIANDLTLDPHQAAQGTSELSHVLAKIIQQADPVGWAATASRWPESEFIACLEEGRHLLSQRHGGWECPVGDDA